MSLEPGLKLRINSRKITIVLIMKGQTVKINLTSRYRQHRIKSINGNQNSSIMGGDENIYVLASNKNVTNNNISI